MRDSVVKGGLLALAALRLQRVAAPRLRGYGAILMLHSVRPAGSRSGFSPNSKLEITPEFLDASLSRIRRLGYRLCSLDAALDVLSTGRATRHEPFIVLTFDDGFRDNLEHALPVLEHHAAPAVIYVTTGLIDRTARLWWVELEEVVRRTAAFDVQVGAERVRCRAGSLAEKRAAFEVLHRALRAIVDDDALAIIADLGRAAGVDARALVDEACMRWDEIERLAAHPLVTIGAHTATHRQLSKLCETEMLAELERPKSELETRLGRPVTHMAFPYGDSQAAGSREYAAASQIYRSAVTSRHGLIAGPALPGDGILPRVAIDGRRQSLGCLEVLLSGLPQTLKAMRPMSIVTGAARRPLSRGDEAETVRQAG